MCFLNLSVVAALKETTALQNRQKMVDEGGVGAIIVLNMEGGEETIVGFDTLNDRPVDCH